MSTQAEQLDLLEHCLQLLPAEDQDRIEQQARRIREIVQEAGMHGSYALALVWMEEAAKE